MTRFILLFYPTFIFQTELKFKNFSITPSRLFRVSSLKIFPPRNFLQAHHQTNNPPQNINHMILTDKDITISKNNHIVYLGVELPLTKDNLTDYVAQTDCHWTELLLHHYNSQMTQRDIKLNKLLNDNPQ